MSGIKKEKPFSRVMFSRLACHFTAEKNNMDVFQKLPLLLTAPNWQQRNQIPATASAHPRDL